MADGVFTPAVSVTSAVGGIAVAKASVINDIIPISIVSSTVYFFIPFFNNSSGFPFCVVRCATIWNTSSGIPLRS